MKVRTEAKREAILSVASKTFLELGFERCTMAEIAARVGGSKATLYGYFPSKEALFLAVTRGAGEKHLQSTLSEMTANAAGDPLPVLQRFGERLLTFMAAPDTVSAHRMVMAEAGHSDIGRLFYEAGPKRGLEGIATFLQAAMDAGRLRRADPLVAAHHFLALLTAETQHHWFLREQPLRTRQQIKATVERSLAAFAGGYGVLHLPSVR